METSIFGGATIHPTLALSAGGRIGADALVLNPETRRPDAACASGDSSPKQRELCPGATGRLRAVSATPHPIQEQARRRARGRRSLQIFALLAFATAPAWSQPDCDPSSLWDLQMQATAERYSDTRDVQIIFTAANRCDVVRSHQFPPGSDQEWSNPVEVFRDGAQLFRTSDEFQYGYTRFAPGEQLSALVNLEKLVDQGRLPSPGYGDYEVRWLNGGLAIEKEISIRFAVAQPGSDARFADAYTRALIRHFPGQEQLPAAQLRPLIWKRLLAKPSERKWVDLLHWLRYDLVDAEALIELLRRTNDKGIRREAVRALAKLGVRPELEEPLYATLAPYKDEGLTPILAATGRVIRGRCVMGDPVVVRCDTRTDPNEACPLMSERSYWTEASGWVAPGAVGSVLPRGPTEINVRRQHRLASQEP